MTHEEAVERLKQLVPGKYCSVELDTTVYEEGDTAKEYRLYVRGPSWFISTESYEKAFEELDAALKDYVWEED